MVTAGKITKSVLGFLWRNKLPIFILALCAILYLQRGTIKNLETDKADLEKANSDYAETLKTVRENTAAQIKALQVENTAAAHRQKQLQQTMEGIYNNDETVDCALPNFVRDAFRRM